MPPKPSPKSNPFLIPPEDHLCASFVKDPRYNTLYKDVMKNRMEWLVADPVVTALKLFEYLERRGSMAEYRLLTPLAEPDSTLPAGIDKDGFPIAT